LSVTMGDMTGGGEFGDSGEACVLPSFVFWFAYLVACCCRQRSHLEEYPLIIRRND
jgi:hypothetical protein